MNAKLFGGKKTRGAEVQEEELEKDSFDILNFSNEAGPLGQLNLK